MYARFQTTPLHSMCLISAVMCQLSQVVYTCTQQQMRICVFQIHEQLRLAHAVSPYLVPQPETLPNVKHYMTTACHFINFPAASRLNFSADELKQFE